MAELITTLGTHERSDLGLVLPHEHVFTDLGPMEAGNWRDADPEDVVDVMAPELERAAEAGVTALVEATPEGVGRRVDVVRDVSEAAGVPVAVATGVYQEPRIPEWAREASEDELASWLLEDLQNGVGETGVRAAWIKVSTDDDDPTGLSADEEKILRAAARAGAETGAVIGSHTLHGEVVHRQLDVIEDAGYDADRFIRIHAQAESDLDVHEAVAERGAYVEYDWIGLEGEADEDYVERIQRLLEAGHESQILLSQDRGFYDPSEPGGGEQRPYTYLVEEFLPTLRAAGVDEGTVEVLTHANPIDAYAR